MRNALGHFRIQDRGSAGVEMALVTPIFLALMFGSFEMGYYFLSEHAVAKAVRDGARYAGRQGFAEFVDESGNCAVSDDVKEKARNVTRTGQVGNDGDDRLPFWTEDVESSSITIVAECDMSGDYEGIYADNAGGAPVVRVIAQVPYKPLFASIVFDTTDLKLNAQSEAPVTGS
jgi:hypothetical protein